MDYSQKDLDQMAARGVSPSQVDAQLAQISRGFPYLDIEAAATVGAGIEAPGAEEAAGYRRVWGEYKAGGRDIVKFVPASGAASRMFKDVYSFAGAAYAEPRTTAEKAFFGGIRGFAFREELCKAGRSRQGKRLRELLAEGRYKEIALNLVEDGGLGYGSLPKGLVLFHEYPEGPRTAMEEHLAEAAMYAASGGKARVHFTVSHSHMGLFRQKVEQVKPMYEEVYGVEFDITFSEQKPETDTVAANPDGTAFRNADGSLLFRPGGHGALIGNLGDLGADIVFVKNIDNVVPDRLKGDTALWKETLAGMAVSLQRRIFAYMDKLESGRHTHADMEEIIRFVQRSLHCRRPDIKHMEDTDLAIYLKEKLNRPLRVCAMVRNTGEPGGGPFVVREKDGSTSLQILESTQIDMANPDHEAMFRSGTHFNPVDIVCATKDHRGRPFDLARYVDPATGFVSNKSKDGRELKALELPGLWNGAMSRWNTVFVEAPLSTFNPVKTINDLLRPEHQPLQPSVCH